MDDKLKMVLCPACAQSRELPCYTERRTAPRGDVARQTNRCMVDEYIDNPNVTLNFEGQIDTTNIRAFTNFVPDKGRGLTDAALNGGDPLSLMAAEQGENTPILRKGGVSRRIDVVGRIGCKACTETVQEIAD